MHVTDDAEICNAEDRRFFVFVDRDDVLRTLHADHVLRRAGNAGRDINTRLHNFASLTNLI